MSEEANIKDSFESVLKSLAKADGEMSPSEKEKIGQIIERRKSNASSSFVEDVMDLLDVACVDGVLDEREETRIIEYITDNKTDNEAQKIFDLARRMELLRLHFKHLILVACADGRFYDEEKEFIESLQKFYLISSDEASLTTDKNEIEDCPYYKGVCVDKKIFDGFIKFLRDKINKDIDEAKEHSSQREYKKEIANSPTIENISNICKK
jgi:tellurite resistance protein